LQVVNGLALASKFYLLDVPLVSRRTRDAFALLSAGLRWGSPLNADLVAYGVTNPNRRSDLAPVPHEIAYPGIEFSPSSRNWWAWLKGSPAECIHIDGHSEWIATLLPDTLYLRGKRAVRREPLRPEVVLCRDCLADTVARDLADYSGRIVAFEPDPEIFTQYFFVGTPDFAAAGLAPEVGAAIEKRLAREPGGCVRCSRAATWLWFSREEVASLDEIERIAGAEGEPLCAEHGAEKLRDAFEGIPLANLFYMNLPYGEEGAYVWI
jgi:hypothetical protein